MSRNQSKNVGTIPSSRKFVSASSGSLLRELVSKFYLPVILVLACIVIGVLRPAFWGSGNINNVLFQAAFTGIVACGMTILIAGGLIDLSVGGVIAMTAITVANILPHTTIGGALAVALLIGAVLGLVNGLVVAILKIPPFIATLGTLYLFLGLAFILTNGRVIAIQSRNYAAFTTNSIGIVPVPFVVFLLLAVLTAFVVHRTYFGRNVRGMGSNEEAIRLAGVSVARTKIMAFVFAGICSALAAVYISGRLYSAEANMSMGFEMIVIAAVVVGGTSMRGGRATILGTVVGSLLFAVLNNALNLFSVASYWQYVLLGVVLVIAIAIGNRNLSDLSVRGEE